MSIGIYIRTKEARENIGKAHRKQFFCDMEGCSIKHYSKGLCKNHYKQQYNVSYYIKNKEYFLKNNNQYRQDNPEYNKQWYIDNPEYHKQYDEQYRQNNKEHISKYHKQYRKKNKEQISEQEKLYYQDNKKKINKRHKQWSQTLAGKAIIKTHCSNHRAMTRDLTKETVQRVYEDNIKKYGMLTCYLCFKPIAFGDDSLEHSTPLSRGGSNDYDNLGIAHRICNIRKHAKTLKEWFLCAQKLK